MIAARRPAVTTVLAMVFVAFVNASGCRPPQQAESATAVTSPPGETSTPPDQASRTEPSLPATSISGANQSGDEGPSAKTSASTPLTPKSPRSSEVTEAAANVPAADVVANNDPGGSLPPTLRRVLVMAPRRPICIEFELVAGGKPVSTTWQQSLNALLEFADEDRSGTTSWDELLADNLLRASGMGNGVPMEDAQRETIAVSYDRDANGIVNIEELVRFFSRGGDSDGMVSLSVARFDPFARIVDSPLSRWLDRDEDGFLSSDEKSQAVRHLKSLDADGDGTVWAADFPADDTSIRNNTPNTANNGMASYSDGLTRGPNPVRLLHEDMEWLDVQHDLEQLYAYGSPLTLVDVPDASRLMKWLDQNNDERIATRELARLQTYPADVVVRVDTQRPAILSVRLADDDDEEDLSEAVRVGDKRFASATVGETELTWRWIVNDSFLAPFGLNHESEIFAQIDTNQDGQIDETEIQRRNLGRLLPFAQVDRDDDQLIDPTELSAFQTHLADFQKSGTQISIRPLTDSVFAALDSNRSQALEIREILSASEQLDRWDKNQDGRFSSSELRSGFTFLISDRPLASQPPFRQNAPDSATEDMRDGPAWFHQMDANGDGEIDRREFLGTAAQFEENDLDRDGFWERTELERIEKAP